MAPLGKITHRFPQDRDIKALSGNMRQSDLDELAVSCGLSADEAVIRSVQASDPAFLRAWLADDELICIAGCSPLTLTSAAPWLLATDLLERYGKTLTREALLAVYLMLEHYPLLANVIDVRQKKSIRWLQGLGFSLGGSVEMVKGFPLIFFEMRAM